MHLEFQVDLLKLINGQENFECETLLFLKRIYYSKTSLKETRSVTMNIFRKKKILFKSFVKMEISYVCTINMFITVENCMEI